MTDFIAYMESKKATCARVGPYIMTTLVIGNATCVNKTHLSVASAEAAEHAYREIMEQHLQFAGRVENYYA